MEKNNIRPHKRLIVWQKSIDLVEKIYVHTGRFPEHELYGLTSQLRRASVSVPANIAEGAARKTAKDYAKFLNTASASFSEADTLIDISLCLKYVDSSVHNELAENINHIAALLNGLIKKVRTTIPKYSSTSPKH